MLNQRATWRQSLVDRWARGLGKKDEQTKTLRANFVYQCRTQFGRS